MKEVVVKVLKKALNEKGVKLSKDQINSMLEIPPSHDFGDFAFPCFSLTEKFKLEPHLIALDIRGKIGNDYPETDFEDIQTRGPYINFFVNRASLAREVVWDIIAQKKKYGQNKSGKGMKTMVEFPSPNTNKPLHLGHLRNMAIGESISRILEFNDEKVIRANLYNDRGIHICKSMLAYQKWGKEKTPEEKKVKPDKFVGDLYVMFEKKKTKKLEAEAQDLLNKWEAGDKSTLLLWKVMNAWAYSGFEQTYKKFGIKHDVNYYESKIYKEGKKIVEQGIDKKIFSKEKNGEVKIDLKKEGLGEKILLRKDGTSLYIVQDLALAQKKFKEYSVDKSLYIVANEQDYHFKVLFSVLEKLGLKKNDIHHVSYGLVNLPSGRMKSREGTVVDADDLITKVQDLAKKEIRKRDKNISKDEAERRSLVVALAAIKYMLLRVDVKKTTLFDPKKSISFDGDTGPYILYSYARAGSILKKSQPKEKYKIEKLEDSEIALVKKLSEFPDVVSKASVSLNPSLIANYVYQLAQNFNEFYHNCKVIGSSQEMFRLALTESFRQVAKNALHLLGIETLEEM